MAKRLDRKLIFYFFAVLVLVIISGVTYSSIKREYSDFQEKLKYSTNRVRTLLGLQVNTYVYGLQGARGVLIADNNRYNPELFKQYAMSRDYFSNFNGLTGYGFIRRVAPKNLSQYARSRPFKIQKVNQPTEKKEIPTNQIKKGSANKTNGGSADHLIVEFIEPIAVNRSSLGFDFSTDPVLKESMIAAARKNTVVLSSLTLVVKNEEKVPGFIQFLPIYDDPSAYKADEDNRWAQTVGWIYGPVSLREFVKIFDFPVFQQFHILLNYEKSNQIFPANNFIDQDPIINNSYEQDFSISDRIWGIKLLESSNEVRRKIKVILLGNFIFYLICLICIYLLVRLYDRQERSLEQKDKWLSALLLNAGHAIIAVDTDGIIRTFSRAAEVLSGYKAYEVIGQQTPEIFYDRNEIVERALGLTKEFGRKINPSMDVFVTRPMLGQVEIRDWTFIRKDGLRIPARLTITAIHDEDDKIIGFMGIAENLTEYKKIKETLEVEQAKLMNAAKMSLLGEMAGGIAHEVNTPLAIIAGKANTLKEKIRLGLPQEQILSDLNTITQTTNRIGRITKSLLTYARSSEKDRPIKIPVSELVQSAMDLCSDKVKANGIELMLDYATPMTIEVRPSEVIQIITNLISNAVDAVKNQSHSWIEIKTVAKNGFGEIWVTDSGLGIDVKIQDKILHPFFTTKPVGSGTGLGLSISKSLAEGLKGDLFLDTKSKNTRFIVRFNIAFTEELMP